MVELQCEPLKEPEFQYDAATLCAAVNIANFIQPCTNQKVISDKAIPMNAIEAWSLLGLTPEVIDNVITVAKLQIIEVLNIVR